MDGPIPEGRWVATLSAKVPKWFLLGTATSDRDMGHPEKPPGHQCGHSLPAYVP